MSAIATIVRRYYRPRAEHTAVDLIAAVRDDAALPGREMLGNHVLVRGNEGHAAKGGLYDPAVFVTPDTCGWIEVGAPLLHPAAAPLVAGCLGLAEDEVWQIVRGERRLRRGVVREIGDMDDALLDETGAEALRRALAGVTAAGFSPAQLISDRLPIPGLADRPLERRVGALMPHVVSVHIQQLLALSGPARSRQGRPAWLAVPAIRALQLRFEALCAELAGGPARLPGGFTVRPGEIPIHPPEPDNPAFLPPPTGRGIGQVAAVGTLGDPNGALALGDRHWLIGFHYLALVIDSVDGSIVHALPGPGLEPIAASADGDVVSFSLIGHLCLRRPSTGTFVTQPPAGLPVHLGEAGLSEVTALDGQTGARWSPIEVGYIVERALLDATGAYLWASDDKARGGIYDVRRGLLELDVADEGRARWNDDLSGDQPGSGAEAFALADDQRWHLFAFNKWRVTGRVEPLWEARGKVLAAAFRPGGRELLVVEKNRLQVLRREGEHVEVVHAYSLAAVRSSLSAGSSLRIDEGLRHHLLSRFGTLAAAVDSDEAELSPQQRRRWRAKSKRLPTRLRPV